MTCGGALSNLSARRFVMRSCKPRAWSTIIWWIASAMARLGETYMHLGIVPFYAAADVTLGALEFGHFVPLRRTQDSRVKSPNARRVRALVRLLYPLFGERVRPIPKGLCPPAQGCEAR